MTCDRTVFQISADWSRSTDDPFRILTARHPHLAPHVRKLKVAVACGDLGTAARLLEGLEIAVEATGGRHG